MYGREGSTMQSLVFMFQKFMMKISLTFASTTQDEYENLYITKSWNVAFNAAALTLSHVNIYVIIFFLSIFL